MHTGKMPPFFRSSMSPSPVTSVLNRPMGVANASMARAKWAR